MEKLAEIKEKLKELSQQEMEELKAFLTQDKEAPVEEVKEETSKAEEEVKSEENSNTKAEESKEAEALPEIKPQEAPNEQESNKGKQTLEETEIKPKTAENGEDEATKEEQQEPITTEQDDIPIMQKGISTSEDDYVDGGSVVAENGEELPIDYEQIVEGLNAKISALEAENASLKNKIEGAFGYSAKPMVPTKVNKLYDECEDVHFHG